jgi:hypothetical protein
LVALTIAAPVVAQVPMTAKDLNRLELNRLATATAAPVADAPAITYSVAQPAAPVPQAFPQLVDPNFVPSQYPFAYLYRYYGYQYPNAYAYIDAGSRGYYAPMEIPVDWVGPGPQTTVKNWPDWSPPP